MKILIFISGILICSLKASDKIFSVNNNNFPNIVYNESGNISITGIFNGHTGSNCSITIARGLEEMSSAIWTVEALNHYQFIPGVQIGLSVFDYCDDNHEEEKSILEFTDRIMNHTNNTVGLGILTTYNFPEKTKSSNKINNIISYVEHIITTDKLVNMVIELLTNLQWIIVDLSISDSDIILNLFDEKTSAEGIQLLNKLIINDRNFTEHINNTFEGKNSKLVVIFAQSDIISNILKQDILKNTKFIIVPTDYILASFTGLTNDSLVLMPSIGDKSLLNEFIRNGEHQKDFLNHKEPIKSPLFVAVASGILKLLKPLKEVQDKYCKGMSEDSKKPCAEVVNFMDSLKENKTILMPQNFLVDSPDDVSNTLEVLKIDPSANDEMFLYIASLNIANVSEDIAIFEIFNLKTKNINPVLLMINDNLLNDREVRNRSENIIKHQRYRPRVINEEGKGFAEKQKTGVDSSLINLLKSLMVDSKGNYKKLNVLHNDRPKEINDFENSSKEACAWCDSLSSVGNVRQYFVKNLSRKLEFDFTGNSTPVVWRFETWVSINTSISFTGVMSTLTIMFFIIIRIYKGDILEGCPYFTFCLMCSVILAYCSSTVFHVELISTDNIISQLICQLKMISPPLIYSILYSLLLSRSLMLASVEYGGGFVDHINGYLQSVLCVFILGIQISLSLQDWLSHDKGSSNCSRNNVEYRITAFGYNMLLLGFLGCVCPFIIRSKRNYREGLLFSLGIFFIVVVWSAWITLFFILTEERREITIAFGLNATASVLLLCVFVPRTYLIAATIVRDKGSHSIPSLGNEILSGISGSAYRSHQTYNPVFGTIIYKPYEMGLSNPNFNLEN